MVFDGEPYYSTVAVSSVGTQSSQEGRSVFLQGYMEMMRRLEPEVNYILWRCSRTV